MDPTKLLETDHRQVEDLFDRIEDGGGGRAARSLVDELTTALIAHMELEESVLYPAMVSVTGHEEVDEGENEHVVAREGLAEMLELVDEPGFGAALESTKAGIAHHVEEEENDALRRAAQGRHRARGDGHGVHGEAPGARASRWTPTHWRRRRRRTSCWRRPGSAGLEVTTSMTKAELAAARWSERMVGHDARDARGCPGRQTVRAPRTRRPGRAPVSSPSWRMTSPATMVAR